ncbi:HalOD1 output domain-containing protein [Haloarcula rubra]|uniref:HalOD1 output domain-containing protein n=1 Tax=Haloarcula rubra TaxID=2487747 RepID=UPI003CCB9175
MTIVEAVTAATDRMAADMPPLHETIDTDALDALLNRQSSSVAVSFRYADADVSIKGNGTLEIEVGGYPFEENNE